VDIRKAEQEARYSSDPADWAPVEDKMRPKEWDWGARWPDGTIVKLAMAYVDEEPVCRSMTVIAPGGVTRGLLDGVPWRDCVAQAVESLTDSPSIRHLERVWTDPPPKRRRARPVVLDEDRLAEAAGHYRDAIRNKDRAPVRYVAEKLGVARGTASNLLVAARRRGLLGPAAPRVAGEIPKYKKKTGRK
jgi:hypothetical protein